MKKVLLLGLILAIFILAMPQGVLAATDSSPAIVTASVQDALDVQATWNGGTWALAQSDNTLNPTGGAINVTVYSTSPWYLGVSDANTGTNTGKMISTTGTTPMIPLGSFFRISRDTPLALAVLPQTTIISNGQAQVPTDYKFAIAQQILPTDDSARDYSITLTFLLTSN
jgi:hypothetical protein